MLYYATRDEMAKLDALAIESGLEIRQMMELAGWHLVEVFHRLGISKQRRVVVLCGKGNKAGDGLCAVRHLHNHGWQVAVILFSNQLSEDSLHQLSLLQKMKVSVDSLSSGSDIVVDKIHMGNLVIDALIGYNLEGTPRDKYAEVISFVNNSGKPAIAYDIPTGIDATTGECFDPCIKADATLTLALPKKAFENSEAHQNSGKIFLGDIGIPSYIYDQIEDNSRPPFIGRLITVSRKPSA